DLDAHEPGSPPGLIVSKPIVSAPQISRPRPRPAASSTCAACALLWSSMARLRAARLLAAETGAGGLALRSRGKADRGGAMATITVLSPLGELGTAATTTPALPRDL